MTKEVPPTYWQQVSQLSISQAVIFLLGLEDPHEHNRLMERSDIAYHHFTDTRDEDCGESFSLIIDAIESELITVTNEVRNNSGELSQDSKISKQSFVSWCQSIGRFDVISLLSLQPETIGTLSSKTKDELRKRRQDIFKRHNVLKGEGVKNPTQKLAQELGIGESRIRQILQKAQIEQRATPPKRFTDQLTSINRKAR